MVDREQDRYTRYLQDIKQGYDEIAGKYRQQKDNHQIQVPPFQQLLEVVVAEDWPRIIELGCGSGYPVATRLLEESCDYTGVDLSTQQISLARAAHPEFSRLFVEQDLLTYLREQETATADIIISLFTIFHLPRERHIDLFIEIRRVLKTGGLMLITIAPYGEESSEDDFFGATMHWSQFSTRLYRQLLAELGFIERHFFLDSHQFMGEEERICYLLLQKQE